MREDELRKLPFVTFPPRDGRKVVNTSFFDDVAMDWVLFVEFAEDKLGRIAGGAPVRGAYYSRTNADPERDLFLPLTTLVRSHLSFPEIVGRLVAVESDIHLFCDILETFEMVSTRSKVDGLAVSLAVTELEFLVRVVRSLYDQLQKLIKQLAILLHRTDDISRRLMQNLPDSFADIVVKSGAVQTSEALASRFQMPTSLANFYAGEANLFLQLRSIRNAIEHQGDQLPFGFSLAEGLAVDVSERPWCDLPIWSDVRLVNQKLGPMRLVFAYLVFHSLQVLERFAQMFSSSFVLPRTVCEGINSYLRNPYGRRLVALPTVLKAPWDGLRV